MHHQRRLQMQVSILIPFLVLIPGAASAGVQFSTMDQVLVGSTLGIAINQVNSNEPGFDVTRRDQVNAPVPGVNVTLHFAGTNLALYSSQNPGTTVDCAARTISRVTDAQGHVKFAAQFGRWNDANVVEVESEGESFGFVKARSPDYDGDGRVGLPDLGEFTSDFFTNTAAPRSDFDLSGATALGDLSIFSVHYLGQPAAAKPLCP
jgi:hypothetical protein